MKKPIGFRSYQNDEEPDKQDELEKQQAERQKAIANFIGQNRVPCRIFGRTTLLGDVRESINSCGCTSFCTNLYKSVQPHLFDK